jgi:hypothetical protein
MERQGLMIRACLLQRDVRLVDIAKELGITVQVVSETIHGIKNNRRVLDSLIRRGVPEEYLALPKWWGRRYEGAWGKLLEPQK